MLKNTSWQVIVSAILAGIGSIMGILSQTAYADTKTGQSILTIGGIILGIGTTFGLYNAKGKSVTTNAVTGQNEPIK